MPLTPPQRERAFAALFSYVTMAACMFRSTAFFRSGQANEAHQRILRQQVLGKLLLDPNR